MTRESDEVIVLFSGGRDSFLAACKLVEKGLSVRLVGFSNGYVVQGENIEETAKRIIDNYGSEHVKFDGVIDISGIWREFFLPYFNMKPSQISEEYGEVTMSQYHCTTCRSAMMTWTINKALEEDIGYIATGARKSQGFVVQLPELKERYADLAEDFGVKLLTPVYDLESDWRRKNELLNRGFVPKTLEPQCLLGVPLSEEEVAPDEEVRKGVTSLFDNLIKPRVTEIIEQDNIPEYADGEIHA